VRVWKWAILAGLFIGLAVLVKIVIVFLVIGAAIAAVLSTLGLRFWKSLQVWMMAALMVIPAFIYYILGHPGRSDEYFFAWTVDLIKLITDHKFLCSLARVCRFVIWIDDPVSQYCRDLYRSAAFALDVGGDLDWIFCLWLDASVPDVYAQLLSHPTNTGGRFGVVPIIEAILVRISTESRWLKAAFVAIIVFVIGYQAWIARSDLVAQASDYSREPAYWENVSKAIPTNANLIGLTRIMGIG